MQGHATPIAGGASPLEQESARLTLHADGAQRGATPMLGARTPPGPSPQINMDLELQLVPVWRRNRRLHNAVREQCAWTRERAAPLATTVAP